MWKKKLESYRDWFLEQENIKVDESKRPDKSFNISDLFGFEESFRQLNVDYHIGRSERTVCSELLPEA
jgi:hypothetical protein